MNLKRLMVILGIVCLVVVIVFTWGCQQTTGPEDMGETTTGSPPRSSKVRSYDSGSCGSYWYTHWVGSGSASFNCGGNGNFSVSYSGANFVTGLGWSTGSSRTISWSGSASGASWGPGVYGWMTNPLVEYYIGKSGGTNRGTYTANGRSYTLYVDRRYNQPSIEGTSDFDQYNCSGSSSSPVNMGEHFDGWRSLGASVGNQNYQVVMVEGWSSNSGSANVTLGGGSSTTTTTSGGYTTTTTTSGSSGGVSIVVRARGTSGNESIDVRVGGNTITTWTLGTGMGNWETSTQYSGGLTVCFTNDSDGRDVQIDYVQVDGQTRQSENQSYNTGVWQDGSCGGEYSEWLHCNGCIGYGDISGGGSTTTTSGGSTTTTTSSSWWWGGWW